MLFANASDYSNRQDLHIQVYVLVSYKICKLFGVVTCVREEQYVNLNHRNTFLTSEMATTIYGNIRTWRHRAMGVVYSATAWRTCTVSLSPSILWHCSLSWTATSGEQKHRSEWSGRCWEWKRRMCTRCAAPSVSLTTRRIWRWPLTWCTNRRCLDCTVAWHLMKWCLDGEADNWSVITV